MNEHGATTGRVNGGAPIRWSFGPLSAWGSIESTTILTTHPSLPYRDVSAERNSV